MKKNEGVGVGGVSPPTLENFVKCRAPRCILMKSKANKLNKVRAKFYLCPLKVSMGEDKSTSLEHYINQPMNDGWRRMKGVGVRKLCNIKSAKLHFCELKRDFESLCYRI